MTSDRNIETAYPDYVWAISKGRYTDLDLNGIDESMKAEVRSEYKISDLARYMLNPEPIEVRKTLLGCEVHYSQPSSNRLREKIKRILPERFRGLLKDKSIPPEVLMSGFERNRPFLRDKDLERHLDSIYNQLRPYDSILKALARLEVCKIADIVAVCEDIDENRSLLALQGGIDEKINYINNFVSKDVRVILERAYISDGLFEMRGFDFRSFDPQNSYSLMKFSNKEGARYCVLDSNKTVEYWVEDVELVHYVHLLEQSIRTNPKFNDAIKLCTGGNATPLKLLFYKKLKIDYSRAHLPKIYREMFETYNMGRNERDLVVNSLRSLQLGVSFNYIPQSDSGEDKMFTNISVMHDFRALETIKDDLPLLYSEINKRTSVSDAGKFYLLDSIRGFRK